SRLPPPHGPTTPAPPRVRRHRPPLFRGRPPQAPITLVRNGREFKAPGDQATVRAGTEIEVRTERPEVTLSLAEMDEGSWVLFKLPGVAEASGAEQPSLAALRRASETSWFRDGDALWVKLVAGPPAGPVIRPTDLQASVKVGREGLGG